MSMERKQELGRVPQQEGPVQGSATPARTRGDGHRVARVDGRSLPDLLRELSTEGADLVRQEVELARAEMNVKLEVFQKSAFRIAVGGAFLVAALLAALWAVNTGLTALFAQFMEPEVAVWASPIVLALILAAIGWGLVSQGRRRIDEEGIAPRRTRASLDKDRRWAASKVRQVKEDMKHG